MTSKRREETRSCAGCDSPADGREAYGIIEGDEVVAVTGDPFAGYEMTRTKHKLRDVKYLVPVIPKTFYAAGLNYVEHVTEMAKKRGEEPNIPPKPPMSATAPTTR